MEPIKAWPKRRKSRFGFLTLNRKKLYLVLGLLFFYIYVAGGSGFYAQVRLWKQGHDLQQQIKLEREKRNWLNDQVTSLTKDRQRILDEAHGESGLGQKDEIIIQVEP